jgi:4-amino-4-deoxy-L-arabinose transferase-like glycosyltransferase
VGADRSCQACAVSAGQGWIRLEVRSSDGERDRASRGKCDTRKVVPRKATSGVLALVLIGFACAALLPGLGRTRLWDPDEPRFAAASSHMLTHGGYLDPVFNDEPRWEKPILLYWFQVASFRVFGVSEWAARLPAALAGVACVLLLYVLGRDLISARAGLIAAGLWLSVYRFAVTARQGLTDVPVLAFLLLAMVGFSRASGMVAGRPRSSAQSSRAAYCGWLAVGLGVLTKGPIGLFPCVIVTGWILISREWSLFRTLRFGAGAMVAGLVALPWYAYAVAANGSAFLDVHVGRELVARAVSPEFGGSRRGPLFYLGIVHGEIAPWTVLAGCAIAWVVARRRNFTPAERRTFQLIGAWVLTVFALFSIARFKLPHYVLPAYPPLLLLTGAFVEGARPGTRWRRLLRGTLAATALMLVAGVAVLAWLKAAVLPDAPANTGILAALALAMAWGCVAAWRDRIDAALILTAMPAALLYTFIAAGWGDDIRSHFQPAQALAHVVAERADESAPLGMLGAWPSIVYYTGRHVTVLPDVFSAARWLATPGSHLLVLREDEAGRLQAAVPEWRCAVLARHPMFAPRLKHILDGRAMRPVDNLVLLGDTDAHQPWAHR